MNTDLSDNQIAGLQALAHSKEELVDIQLILNPELIKKEDLALKDRAAKIYSGVLSKNFPAKVYYGTWIDHHLKQERYKFTQEMCGAFLMILGIILLEIYDIDSALWLAITGIAISILAKFRFFPKLVNVRDEAIYSLNNLYESMEKEQTTVSEEPAMGFNVPPQDNSN